MYRFATALLTFMVATTSALAADPIGMSGPANPAVDENGIWGAIAIAPADGRYGFFWGGASREDAGIAALDHCDSRGGSTCYLAIIFRSLSQNKTPDATGFPYNRCGALAIPDEGMSGRWSAASASSRSEAEAKAIERCGGEERCEIQEWVCT